MFMFYFLLTTNQCNCNVNDLKGLSFYNSSYDDVVDAKEMMKISSDADVVAAKETMKSFSIRCEKCY